MLNAIGIALLLSTVNFEAPKPFTTDLCTRFPEGTAQSPRLWESCCVRHDLEFWAGGKSAERDFADFALRECVRKKGAPFEAYLMWLGVRIGGRSPVKFPGKQWGNAWGDAVRDESLSSDEVEELEQSLRSNTDLDLAVVEDFIRDLESRTSETKAGHSRGDQK